MVHEYTIVYMGVYNSRICGMLLVFCGMLLRHVTGGMFPVRIDGTVTHYDCIFTNSALIVVHTSGRAARTAATGYCSSSCKNLAAGQQHKIHHAAGGIWGRGPKFRAAHITTPPRRRGAPGGKHGELSATVDC